MLMLKLGMCKYMMAKTVHTKTMFRFALLMCRKLSPCLFVHPFKQLCLTAETGVHLIQLLLIGCMWCLESASGIRLVYTLDMLLTYSMCTGYGTEKETKVLMSVSKNNKSEQRHIYI